MHHNEEDTRGAEVALGEGSFKVRTQRIYVGMDVLGCACASDVLGVINVPVTF